MAWHSDDEPLFLGVGAFEAYFFSELWILHTFQMEGKSFVWTVRLARHGFAMVIF